MLNNPREILRAEEEYPEDDGCRPFGRQVPVKDAGHDLTRAQQDAQDKEHRTNRLSASSGV